MRKIMRHGVRAAICSVALLAGCIDFGGPPDDGQPPEGVVISEPRLATAGPALGAAAPAIEESVSWVSASPGTFDDGLTVQIRNVAANGAATDPVAVIDGGFDPVAIGAVAGDELELTVLYASGDIVSLHSTVPIRRPPVVVRTQPPDGRIDVALSVWPTVVFSEPIDRASLTQTAVQLVQNDAGIVGDVDFAPNTPFAVQFVPQGMLQPLTTYELVVTRDIRDLDGQELEQEVRTSFTTRAGATLSGSMALFSHDNSDPNYPNNGEIYVVNANGSDFVNLTNHPAWDGSPAVSPDGTRILFTSDRSGDSDVYVMNADGSGIVNLTRNSAPDGNAVWSPDGTRIAFISLRESVEPGLCGGGLSPVLWPCPDIWVMDADGSNPVNLTQNPDVEDTDPAWSPDGTRIAFTSNRYHLTCDSMCGDYSDIWVMNADGSNMVRLTQRDGPSRWGYGPAWSPDGSTIAFTGGPAPSRIWVMDADGTNPAALTDFIYSPRRPTWSRDGTRIAFTMLNPVEFEDGFAVDLAVFIMNADGSGMVNVTSRNGFDDRIGSPQGWWR